MSVVVSGRYEELVDSRSFEFERTHAHALLQKRAMWWQAALVVTDLPKEFLPIFYRIHIVEMTGHSATPDKIVCASAAQV